MRLLVRGLAYLPRTIPANVSLIARVHTSSIRHKNPPSSRNGKSAPVDNSKPSSLEPDEDAFRQYFYRLPDPVLDDVQVEDFDGEIGPKTRVLETKAPDIYSDEDVENLWKRLQDKFTEEDFANLEAGDQATEDKFLKEIKKLWLMQGREEWEGLESKLEEKLQDEAPPTSEELEGYIADLQGEDPKRASDIIPNFSSRYTDLDAIDEFSDEPLLDRDDLREALKTLKDAVPEEYEDEGEDGSPDRESMQEMLRRSGDTEPEEPIDVDGERRVEGGHEAASVVSSFSNQNDKPQDLQQYDLQFLRRSHQTGKGKMASWYCLTVVGNGNGLVGVGEGKSTQGAKAREYAFSEAKRNMDYVDRFENRTIWTEMQAKFGGTRLIMRPRPVGFGLMCSPDIHQVLKAAGIKDCSAKLWGSRNKIISVKLVIKMLHAGHQPLYFGNGVGGQGVRLEKGMGMRNKTEVERERGRRIVDARLW